ncbi:DUF4373 domain-containing protein [Peptostreptococcaceae bacterium OttesenSCG-928-C18]|nr:DUF4373 domain-containing protein [Peptostreptococcaceae bacterium OttesenSCG-928-C18]
MFKSFVSLSRFVYEGEEKMARPFKKGIDYFPLDVTFLRNIKVRKIVRTCGNEALSVLVSILCNIYQAKGYYCIWDTELCFLVADEVGVCEDFVFKVAEKAVQVGFFNKKRFEDYEILTSKGIQRRYLEITSKRKRVDLVKEYMVLGVNDYINLKNVNINGVNSAVNTQSKVEESKVNKSKEKKSSFEDEVISLWNSINGISNIKVISTGSKRFNYFWSLRREFGDEAVIEAINNISKSDFLRGKVTDFKITFDWFLMPSNFLKVYEGNYNNKDKKEDLDLEQWKGLGQW